MKGGLLVVLALMASLSGCQTLSRFSAERSSRNIESGHAWISDQILPAEINVSVSGRKAYLLASQGGRYYYSIVLEMPSPNLLIGYYSRSIPYQSSSRRDIRLDRTGP